MWIGRCGKLATQTQHLEGKSHPTNVKYMYITNMDTYLQQRGSRNSLTTSHLPHWLYTSHHYLITITCNTPIPTQHADESSHPIDSCSKRTRQTCAGVARVELFTLHSTTPHPMNMHTVAPNRLQDDLCNLWRLHISHRQHTHTHRPQTSKPLPIINNAS
jgi:hypothetical protein